MITLARRLVFGDGREAVLRSVATATGVAWAVIMLLFAAVAFPALHAHDVHAGWLKTRSHNAHPIQDEAETDPLLFRVDTTNFENRDIVVVDVAALGPRSPVPPGLSRLPGPGQYAVSPALARLIATTPSDMLADRFPGKQSAVIGDAALAGPDQLVVVIGHSPAALRGLTNVDEVRSIEGAPQSHGYNQFFRVVLVIGALALLLPVMVFVSTSTRLAAARREQRLAALRLVGATPRFISVLAATEAGVTAVAGTAIGFAGFLATQRYAARIPLDGNTFFPSDIWLSPVMAALVAFGVPALAVVAAQHSLRRLQVTPLGVARQAPRARPTWRRLVPLAFGMAGFAVALPIALAGKSGNVALTVLCAAFALVVIGLIIAGPWLTSIVGAVILRWNQGSTGLIAGRRLKDNSAGAFQSIGGLILAVFVATLVCGLLPSALQTDPQGKFPMPMGSILSQFGGEQATGLAPSEGNTLLTLLRENPGVTRVIPIRRAPEGSVTIPTHQRNPLVPVLLRCDDLLVATSLKCAEPTATVALDIHELDDMHGSLFPLERPMPAESLNTLPLAGLIVLTDGQATSMERARAAIYSRVPIDRDFWVTTSNDQDALLKHRLSQLLKLAEIALVFTLILAGCSLTVSLVVSLIDRRRSFAVLRLAGAQPAQLRRVIVMEAAAPLLSMTATTTALALGLSAMLLDAGHFSWRPPDTLYWTSLAGGLLATLLLAVGAATPLLGKLTSPDTARPE